MMKSITIDNSISDSIRMMTEINFSKEFRRLQDKTQMFNTRLSEHFRTRLTHTIEVSSISERVTKGILDAIKKLDNDKKFNIDDCLVRAIAYSHDLGHTPYGHIGEDVIFDLLVDEKLYFKHNIQSTKILLDPRVINANSLDSGKKKIYNFFSETYDWRLFDGAIKHTKSFPRKANAENFSDDPYNLMPYFALHPVLGNNDFQNNIKEFVKSFINFYGLTQKALINGLNTKLFIDKYLCYPSALSLEGQIVAISDEISQRMSDLDDSLRLYHKTNYTNKYDIELAKLIQSLRNYAEELKGIPLINNNDKVKVDKKIKNLIISNRDIPNRNFTVTKTIINATINYCNYVAKLLEEFKKDNVSSRNKNQFQTMKKTGDFLIENLVIYVKLICESGNVFKDSFDITYKNDTKTYDLYQPFLIQDAKTQSYKPIISLPLIIENVITILEEFNKTIISDDIIKDSNEFGEKNIISLYKIYLQDIRLVDNNCKRLIVHRYREKYVEEHKKDLEISNKALIDEIAQQFNDSNNGIGLFKLTEEEKSLIKQIILESIARMTDAYVEKMLDQNNGYKHFEHNLQYDKY